MSKQIFDQDRPRSTMAQPSTKLSPAAISGPSWRAAAAKQPRLQPPRLQQLEDLRQSCRGADPGAARAVVVGVVQEEDVPGPDAGGHATRDRLRRRPAVPVPPPLRPQHRPPAAAADGA